MTQPRALLISLRDPHDPMASHERLCFAERALLPVDHIDVHFMSEQGRPSPAKVRRHDAVFFGGSGAYSVLDDVGWIRESLDTLVEVLDLRVPAWASCFGFQGLAVALGGEVVRDDDRTEMGATELFLTDGGRDCPLFSRLPDPFWAQEGHHDVVERMPPGATLLCSSVVCEAQAFRVDGSVFWASQFHPELTPARTADRFRHYRDHYFEGDADAMIAKIESGIDTPEVSDMLARLVRRAF